MLVSLFSAVPHKPLLEMSGLVNIPPHLALFDTAYFKKMNILFE